MKRTKSESFDSGIDELAYRIGGQVEMRSRDAGERSWISVIPWDGEKRKKFRIAVPKSQWLGAGRVWHDSRE